MNYRCLVAAAFGGLSLLPALPAQFERELDTPTGFYVLSDVDVNTVVNQTNQGYRLTDIEVLSASPLRFTATFVANQGAYASGYWWYFGQTPLQVAQSLSQNQARLIDIEPYDDGSGNIRFATIMVPNTGGNYKQTWYTTGMSATSLANTLSSNSARLIDLDEYVIGGVSFYSAVMIHNSGQDARAWWWYLGASAAQVDSLLAQNQARPIDLDRRANGTYNVIMQRDPVATSWSWRQGLSLGEVLPFVNEYGLRPIDIETYVSSGVRRYTVVGIRNTDPVTADIVTDMHSTTDGTMGAYMRVLNGGKVYGTNENRVFEPASTMKTLHHVHAMKQVDMNQVTMTTPLTVYQTMNGSCPVDTNPTSEALQTVLMLMMVNSDNARTQAVTARFGQSAINATAAALGMSSTSLNHRLGCHDPSVQSPNQITLADLGRLHSQVANGYLGQWRDTFYGLMLNSISDFSVSTMIDQEAVSLGIPTSTRNSFKAMVRMAHKGGNYSQNYPVGQRYQRAEFGYLSLPFVVGNTVTPREFGFGAFVNMASVDQNAANAIYSIALPKMLRPQIHAALATWNGMVASVQPYGTGCGSPTPYTQTTFGLPRLNTHADYRANNGFANSLAMFAVGLSNTVANGLPLPLSLQQYGSDPGCMALCNVLSVETGIATQSGFMWRDIYVPNQIGLVGLHYYTQFYTFDGVTFRSSNGVDSRVGL